MKIKDRIKELRRVKASELLPNPKNWRTHPESQQNAMRGILAEVGIADAVLARETPDGLMLIDGHLRAEIDAETEWPVLVLDVTEAEADKILATHDPLAAMAETDAVQLDALLRDVETGSQDLADMLEKLAEDAGLYLDEVNGEAGGTNDETYTRKIESPIYEPKGECPKISDLYDNDKTKQLLKDIDNADIPSDVAGFLRLAAERHTSFHFRNIAEFYCHANATVQDLMERSGLVIIDFNKAVECGFVYMTDEMGLIADLELSEREYASR